VTEIIKIWTTPTARAKIRQIYNYSCDRWNEETAKKYLAGLEEVIKSVAKGRTATKINREFSTRFSYCTAKRHYIFFEHQKDKLIVASIFHTSMDVQDRMTEEMTAIDREINAIEDEGLK